MGTSVVVLTGTTAAKACSCQNPSLCAGLTEFMLKGSIAGKVCSLRCYSSQHALRAGLLELMLTGRIAGKACNTQKLSVGFRLDKGHADGGHSRQSMQILTTPKTTFNRGAGLAGSC